MLRHLPGSDVFRRTTVVILPSQLAPLLVEQDARSTFAIAEQVYVLEHGRIVRNGKANTLAADDEIRRIYLGV